VPLAGVWKSRGYGWFLEIDEQGYSLIDRTDSACVEFERGTAGELDPGFEFLAQENENHIALRVRNDITRYDFERVARLPAGLQLLDDPRRTDPLLNLDFFCEAFANDYAFFDLRGVNWSHQISHAKSRISRHSSADELFAELHALITPLADNHVMLSDGAQTVISENLAGIKSLMQNQLDLGPASIGNPASIARIRPFIDQEFFNGDRKVAGNGAISWGMITPQVGYLNILKMFGLADTPEAKSAIDLPPRRPDHARFLHDDLKAIEAIMDQVMADLGHSQAIILDVRINGGGFDNVGMAIANRFTDRRRLAFTKHARLGSAETPKQEFHIQPSGGDPFTRPVFVLTSARTASAGDVFALCMHCLPHVTLIGQPSTGILSDNLRKHLPNGWITSISNESYCSADGTLFEGPGVPVDFETPVFLEEDFKAGFHMAVDKALELATGRPGGQRNAAAQWT
jgi:carboxyl-terminal processing protease